MIKLIFKIFLLLEVCALLYLFFGTISIQGKTCQKYLNMIEERNNLKIQFKRIDFNLRKVHFHHLKVSIKEYHLASFEKLLLNYSLATLMTGKWANLRVEGILASIHFPEVQSDIRGNTMRRNSFLTPFLGLETLEAGSFVLNLKGGIRQKRFYGTGKLEGSSFEGAGRRVFIKKLGQFLRLSSFETLNSEKITFKFKNEGLALEIFELQAISNDYEINGWGKYTWGQNLKCDFELKYYAYIPAHKEKEGPLYITFRVYGPLEHLGYRITG